jgi:pimeloyl-ACP methyl ester carboxylesterase
MTFVPKKVELSNGVVLPHVEQGNPTGPSVLLLHGVTDSWHSFEPVLPYLPNTIRVFAITQRGHGDASRPESYRYRDFAADIAAFMDALNIPSAIIAGHSMGSAVAQRFALDYPDRIHRLVLIASFDNLTKNPSVREMWDSYLSTLRDPVDPGFVREFQQSTLAQPVPEAYFETVVNESLKVPARVWQATFKGFLEDDFSNERGNIKTPTLIVWGDQDAFCSREDQDRLNAAIPNSQLVIYAGAGHALHWEEPQRFAADLLAFSKQI